MKGEIITAQVRETFGKDKQICYQKRLIKTANRYYELGRELGPDEEVLQYKPLVPETRLSYKNKER